MKFERFVRTLLVIILASAATIVAISIGSEAAINRLIDERRCDIADPRKGAECLQEKEIAINESNIRITAVGMVASVVSTIGLVITIFFTARATMAALDAAAMGRKAIAHAEHVAGLEYRPYMVFYNVSLSNSVDQSGEITSRSFRINWHNSGKTPATHAQCVATALIFDEPVSQNFRCPWSGNLPSQITCGPNQSMGSDSISLSLDDIQAVINGTKYLYVYGWIEYQGTTLTERYRTEFSSQIGLFGGDADSHDLQYWLQGGLIEHNGFDDSCTYPPITAYVKGRRG